MKREQEPESKKLFRELEDLYLKHPTSTPAVTRHIEKIRRESEEIIGLLQKDFDKQYEETTCIFLRRELDFIKGLIPEKGVKI